MAENKKIYSIEIQGVKQSISEIEALTTKLQYLDQRMRYMSSLKLDLGVSGAAQAKSALEEQDRLMKQIQQTEQRIAAAQREEYQSLLANKELLADITNEAKVRAATERMTVGEYQNSMRGLKQELSDVKTIMQSLDLGSEEFRVLSDRAAQLTTRLKDVEQAYGQFGRNVGNYSNSIQQALGGMSFGIDTSGLDKFEQTFREVVSIVDNFKVSDKISEDLEALKSKFVDVSYAATRMGGDFTNSFKALELIDRMMAQLATQYQRLVETQGQAAADSSKIGQQLKYFTDLYKDALKEILVEVENLSKIKITIGGEERTFDTLRNALRTLREELKVMVVQGREDTEAFRELSEALHNLEMKAKQAESAMKDLQASSQFMDDMLDTAESFVALGSMGQGLQTIFGFDNNKIQESIQKMVALQSVLNGLEKIRKQMNTQEGIGKWFSTISTQSGKMAEKLLMLTGALKSVDTASKGTIISLKLLKTAIATTGIGLLVIAIGYLVNGISDAIKSLNTMETKTRALSESIDGLTSSLERNRSELGGEFMSGAISQSELMRRQWDMTNESILKQIQLIRELTSVARKGEWYNLFGTDFKMDIKQFDSIDSLTEKWKKMNEAIREGQDYYSKWGSGFSDFMKGIWYTVNDTEEMMNQIGQMAVGQLVNDFEALTRSLKNGSITVDQYAKQIGILSKQMNSNEMLSSVLANLDKYIPDEKVREKVENIINEMRRLDDQLVASSREQQKYWTQMAIDAMEEGLNKQLAQIKLNREYELSEREYTQKQVIAINKKYDRQVLNARKAENDRLKSERDKANSEMLNAEKDLAAARLNVLKDSLTKTLQTLKNEWKQRLNEVRKSGIMVKERELALEQYYNMKMVDARVDYYSKLKSADEAYAREHRKLISETYSIGGQNALSNVQSDRDAAVSDVSMSPIISQDSLDKDIAERIKAVREYYENILSITEKYSDKEREIQLDTLEREIEDLRKAEEERNKLMAGRLDGIKGTSLDAYVSSIDSGELAGMDTAEVAAYFQNYRIEMNKWLDDLYKGLSEGRISEQEYIAQTEGEYTQHYMRLKDEYDAYIKVYESLSDSQKAKEKSNLDRHIAEMNAAFVQYLDNQRKEYESHNNRMNALTAKYEAEKRQIEEASRQQLREARMKDYDGQVSELDYAMGKIADRLNKHKVMFKGWEIIDLASSRKNLREVSSAVTQSLEEIKASRDKLQKDFDMRLIDQTDYDEISKSLDSLEEEANDTALEIQESMRQLSEDFASSINTWVSAVGNAMNTILSSISEIQGNQYDAQIDKLQEFIDKYAEKLKELESIINEHSKNVDSIEDELKNARGDRRQALIDQLNAEKAAQRSALAEEKRIQKEKEKEEARQRKLEVEKAKADKKMKLAQAAINMAMAISMAAVNSWPVPAVVMMALAAAAGAAQIAAIQSTNIPSYGDGGVLQGKSHRQGGIKVLGGQAEVEGNEFITNKVTTQKNVELMYYINSKKKKLSLDDFIEFYSDGKKVSSNVKSIGSKFANGGVLPQIRTDVNLSDRLLTAFEDYSRRPVVVSVVDIMDKTQSVNEVRVLAGLES